VNYSLQQIVFYGKKYKILKIEKMRKKCNKGKKTPDFA
jgi:hypothetical protein